MQEKINRITSLIEKFLEETLSAEEDMELKAWLAESEQNDSFFRQITDKKELREKLRIYSSVDSEAIWKKTLQQIDGGAKLVDLYPEKKTVKIPFGKIAAAASIIVLISAGSWYFTRQHPASPTASNDKQKNSITSRVVPGSNKATLTLADGKSIILNTVQNGNLAEQGNMQVTKTDGRLIYNMKTDFAGSTGTNELYNTVSTPKGGEYQITLPDGSKVWLNAASSLRFPIAFAGNERIVELTGEAYFEVNPQTQPGAKQQKGHSGKTPFIVKINTPGGNKNEVEVLGTHFNVMAYTDEGAIQTTLIEGKVKVTSGNKFQTIRPGEQAKLGAGSISVQHVDTEDVIGWTTGLIPVEGHDLEYTMRQIARWYDVEIDYQGKKPQVIFEGKLSRTATIENIIELLKLSNIKATLDEKGRKIVVTS